MSDSPYSSSFLASGIYNINIEPEIVSPTEQYAHVSSFTANPAAYQSYKFNILYPAISSSFSASWSGSAVGNMLFATNRWAIGSTNDFSGPNTVLAKTSHGPGSGSYSLYRTFRPANAAGGSWRLYRIPLSPSRYYTASQAFTADHMFPVPPGSLAMRQSTSGQYQHYISTIDRFIISADVDGWFGRYAMFKYDTNFGRNSVKQVLYMHSVLYNILTTINEDQPKLFFNNADTQGFFAAGDDMGYFSYGGNVSAPFGNNILFSIPIGAHYEDTPKTKQWVTFPPINTSDAQFYRSVYLKHPKFIGSDNLGYAPERLVIFYRTSGIADDSGEWIRLDDSGDLSKIIVSDQIQFSVAFDVMGMTGLFNRLYSLCLTYEDDRQDSHYLQSFQRSDIPNKKIVWVQTKKWNKVIPDLKVRFYNADTDQLLLEDSTDAQSQGTFEYSSNGGNTYLLWNNTQDNIGNYVRYTANFLPTNTRVRVVLNLK
jgi:hypothetical protein